MRNQTLANLKSYRIKPCGECPLLPTQSQELEAEREPTDQFADPALEHLARGVGQ